MDRKQLGSSLMLLLATIIWGGSFVVMRVGLDSLGPMTFSTTRFLIAGVAMLPLLLLRRHTSVSAPRTSAQNKLLWKAGALCGLALFALSSFQQIGLIYTTAGKSAFVTTLYVVLVPVFGLLFGKRAEPLVWIGVALAACGLFFLCVSETFVLNRGDVITLGCAVCCAVYIMLLGRFSAQLDGIAFACIQFFTAGALFLITALLTETATFEQIYACRYLLLYAGVLSNAVANTLQIFGQKNLDDTIASLIMCLESMFAVLAGWIFLNELLTAREWLGCVLMFIAIVLTQLPRDVWHRLFKGRAQPAMQEQPKSRDA